MDEGGGYKMNERRSRKGGRCELEFELTTAMRNWRSNHRETKRERLGNTEITSRRETDNSCALLAATKASSGEDDRRIVVVVVVVVIAQKTSQGLRPSRPPSPPPSLHSSARNSSPSSGGTLRNHHCTQNQHLLPRAHTLLPKISV